MAGKGPSVLAVRDLSGGLNLWADNHGLADNEVPDCANVWFRPGVTERRKGYAKVNGTAEGSHACIGLYRTYRGGTGLTYAAFNTTLYQISSGSLVSVTTGTLQSGETLDFETWHDLDIWVQPSKAPKKYDGSSVADLGGTPPQGAFIIQHANRLWIAGNSTNPSRLYFSDLADPETWGSTSYLDIDKGGSDEITGLARSGADLIVFKRKSSWIIHNVYGQPSGFQQVKLAELGCTSNLSIAERDGWVYFLSERGVYRLRGYSLEYVGRNVQPKISSAGSLDTAVGAIWQHYYWLALPAEGGTTNSFVLALDIETAGHGKGVWTLHDDIRAAAFAVYDGAGDTGDLYWGSADSVGFVYQGNTGNADAGDAFEARVTTKQYDMGSSPVVKRFRKASVDALTTGDSWAVDVLVDGSTVSTLALEAPTTTNLWGVMQWGVGKWETPQARSFGDSLPRSAIGRQVQLIIRALSDSDGGQVKGFYVAWEPRRVRFE